MYISINKKIFFIIFIVLDLVFIYFRDSTYNYYITENLKLVFNFFFRPPAQSLQAWNYMVMGKLFGWSWLLVYLKSAREWNWIPPLHSPLWMAIFNLHPDCYNIKQGHNYESSCRGVSINFNTNTFPSN